jgi:hypothetical protein
MQWQLVGIILGLLGLAVFAQVYQNNFVTNSPANFSVYCAVYPYSYNNMNPLNQTDFEMQIQKAKEIGFKGVLLWNVECFYDDGKLEWIMGLLKNCGLDVVIPVQYFNRACSLPFPSEAWNRKGFMENDEELNLFCEYLTNVSLLVRSYVNFKGWIIYYPFNSTESEFWYWHERIAWISYKWKLQYVIDAIRKASGHPIYLGVELWKEYPQDLYDRLPKDFNFIDGFSFQPYNTIKDDIQKDKIKELYLYWKKFSKNVQIAEFGYATQNSIYTHGLASTETRKAEMIKEFLNYVKSLGFPDFVSYFGLTDFPPENADFGLIYANYTLKPSGNAMKEWITKNET